MKLGNVMILGDSYSTFEGLIPEGYATWYSPNESEKTDVRHADQIWWHGVLEELCGTMVLNNSWSGSTVCYTGYEGVDCSETSSFLYRFEKLKREGFFAENRIDTLFVFGGTNDSWAEAPLGEAKFSDWEKQDLYQVLPAICCLSARVRETLPSAKIVFLINTELKPEIGATVKAAAERFGIEYLELHEIHKDFGHPTIRGMEEIKEQVLEYLK